MIQRHLKHHYPLELREWKSQQPSQQPQESQLSQWLVNSVLIYRWLTEQLQFRRDRQLEDEENYRQEMIQSLPRPVLPPEWQTDFDVNRMYEGPVRPEPGETRRECIRRVRMNYRILQARRNSEASRGIGRPATPLIMDRTQGSDITDAPQQTSDHVEDDDASDDVSDERYSDGEDDWEIWKSFF